MRSCNVSVRTIRFRCVRRQPQQIPALMLPAAGGRGFFLKREGVLLNQALISFALQSGYRKGFQPMQTPFFMRQSMMAMCAQLSQFDEELYTVTGGRLRTVKRLAWPLVMAID